MVLISVVRLLTFVALLLAVVGVGEFGFLLTFPFIQPSLPRFTFWWGDMVLRAVVRLLTFVALLLAVVISVSLIFY